MNNEKVAIVTDSCCDVPKSYTEKYPIYVLPVKIFYGDKMYLDGVDITPAEVYARLEEEIPKTSLPDGQSVLNLFNKLKDEGFNKILVITLSSGLSGTNNMMRLMAEEVEDMEVKVIDTRNIAIASGLHVIKAAELLAGGMSFDETARYIQDNLSRSKVFFVVETLEYLQKGGRIGLVASLFGNRLNIKPIISCNPDGIYYTVAKVRGRKKSISKDIEEAMNFVGDSKRIFLALYHGAAKEELEKVKEEVLSILKDKKVEIAEYCTGEISPSLGINTGPGLIGIGVYRLD